MGAPTMLDPRRRIALNVITNIIWFVFFGMRLFSRYYGRRKSNLGLSWYTADILVFVAILLVTGSNSTDTWVRAERLKQDPHPWVTDGQPSLIIRSYQIAFYNIMAFVTCLWCIKASFLISYYNLISFVSKTLRRLLKLSAVLLGVTWLVMMLVLIFWCRPIKLNWTLGHDFCSPQTAVSQTAVFYALHMLTDIPILLLPVFILRSLKLHRNEQFALFFVYGLGIVTISSSTIRFVFHIRFADSHNTNPYSIESSIERIYFVSLAEATMSIVLVCTPSLRVLVRMIRGEKTESGPSGTGTGGLTTGERRMRLVVTQKKEVGISKSRIGEEGDEWELVRKGSSESGDTEAKLAAAGNRGIGVGYRAEITAGGNTEGAGRGRGRGRGF